MRLKCSILCESLPVLFILGMVESVIPDSFRARDLVFLSLSVCRTTSQCKAVPEKVLKGYLWRIAPKYKHFSLLNSYYLLRGFALKCQEVTYH